MVEVPYPDDEVVLSPKEISALQELVSILRQEKGMAKVGDLPGKYKEPLMKLGYVVDSAIITEDIVANIVQRYVSNVSSASTVSSASSGDSRESVEKKSVSYPNSSKSSQSSPKAPKPSQFEIGRDWDKDFKIGKDWEDIDVWLKAVKRVLINLLEDKGRNTADASRVPLRLGILYLFTVPSSTLEGVMRGVAALAKQIGKKIKQKNLENSLALLNNLPGVKTWTDLETSIQYYQLTPEMKKLIYGEYLVLKAENTGSKFDAGSDKEEQIMAFVTFFRDYMDEKGNRIYINELARIMTEYPKRSLDVDWTTLNSVAPNLARLLILHPEKVIEAAEDAVYLVLKEDLLFEHPPKIHVRFYNLPETYDVRKVGPELINRFVQVRGIISKISSIEPFVQKAVFVCRDCGNEMIRLQHPFSLVMNKPYRCDACGSRSMFLDDDRSTFIRYQSAHIQDFPEELRGGQMPAHLSVVFMEELTDRVLPGDRVVLTGVLKRVEEKREDRPIKKLVLIVNHIEKENEDAEEIDITPEEEQEFIKESQRKDFAERLVDSFAPSIHGHRKEKKGLLLTLFSGEDYKTPTGEYVRGRSHILLVGDPGTSKSDLLRFARSVAPRAVYASGKATTGAGLTASAVKDEFTGKWTIEAGTLVLADKGFAIIDELDKAHKEDRNALHEPMEQGVIGFAKAGINADVNARATVIAAANPIHGKLNPNKTVLEQTDLPDTLISRFDMIFGFWDRPDEKLDYEIAVKIGQRRFQPEKISAPYSQEWMRKYIAYARKKRPSPLKMSSHLIDYISKQYASLRKKYGNSLTARFADGLYRLAEAHARMYLREEVTQEDVDAIIELMDYMFSTIAKNEEGEVDAMILEVGKSSAKLKRLDRLMDIIKKLQDEHEWGAREDDVIHEARMAAIGTEHEIKELLSELFREGVVYQPRSGYWRVSK